MNKLLLPLPSLKRIVLHLFWLELVLSVGVTCVVQASTEQKATAFVLCKSQKSVRTIRILPEKDNNCTITYSKNGAEEVVGSNRSVQTCRSILKSIETHLEDAKWSCRNVETAHLMTSSEVNSVQ